MKERKCSDVSGFTHTHTHNTPELKVRRSLRFWVSMGLGAGSPGRVGEKEAIMPLPA